MPDWKPPFEKAICQACLGHGTKCTVCKGKHYVTAAKAYELWGQAFEGHLEGKKFVLDYGGTVPHIPVIKPSKAEIRAKDHRRRVAESSDVGVPRSVPKTKAPEPNESGVTKSENGDVFIHAETAQATVRMDTE